MAQTPALLTGVYQLNANEGIILAVYQGIRFTLIPSVGGTLRYSKIDDPNIEAVSANHPGDTRIQFDVTDVTTVDCDWPYYLVTCESGTGKIGLV